MHRLLALLVVLALAAPAAAQTITGTYLYQPMPEPGTWWDPNASGTGWFLDSKPGANGGTVGIAAHFGFEAAGDSRYWLIAGPMVFAPDPTGPTDQRGLPMATLTGAVAQYADGQCFGCPYRNPVATAAHEVGTFTWIGPREVAFNAGGVTVIQHPFDTVAFDLAGDWQGANHFFDGTNNFITRPIFRFTRRTDARAYHLDPNYQAGFVATLPTPGAIEYDVMCVVDCARTFEPIGPTPEITWWVDPVTGNGSIMYVRQVNQTLFPTRYQIYAGPGNSGIGRWAPRVWATRGRIVARACVGHIQPPTVDTVKEIELTRLAPGLAALIIP